EHGEVSVRKDLDQSAADDLALVLAADGGHPLVPSGDSTVGTDDDHAADDSIQNAAAVESSCSHRRYSAGLPVARSMYSRSRDCSAANDGMSIISAMKPSMSRSRTAKLM